MPTTVILSAHGEMSSPVRPITLDVKLTTSCRFGATYAPQLLQFSDLSIFSDRDYLYEYIMKGADHTTQGEVVEARTRFNNVILTPFPKGDATKSGSWQQPYVENHLITECKYNLADTEGFTTPIRIIKGYSTAELSRAAKDIKPVNHSLIRHIDIVSKYSASVEYQPRVVVDEGHSCSLTKFKNNLFYIFDYEAGPSRGARSSSVASDEWDIADAVTSINHYLDQRSVDLVGVEYVLQSCLGF